MSMVKINLPHMYMIFVECKRKQVCSSILQYPQTFQHFQDHKRPSQALRPELFGSAPASSKTLSSFFLALIVGLIESFAPFLESYKQLFHPSCSTASNGCKAQPKIFRASKRGEGLERVAYDPKSVEKFGGIVEQMNRLVFFYIQQKSCTYAVNVF